MREIEIKATVLNADQTLQALKDMGVSLSSPIKQHDVVYGPAGARNGDDVSWLRIRTENDSTVIFTLKKSVTGQLDSIEHEVIVDDAAELTAIIANLGYELYSDLTKIRQKGKLQEYEVCYDILPDIGTFIELEKLCADDADIQSVTADLWATFEKIDVQRSEEVTDGYDVMERKIRGVEA